LRILHVVHRYYPQIGGAETYATEITRRLSARGFDVEVVTTDPTFKAPLRQEIEGVKVLRFKTIAPHGAYFLSPQIWVYVKKRPCDLIHLHDYHLLPALFGALARDGRPTVFTPHYHGKAIRKTLNRLYKPLGARIFRESEKVICVSHFERELILRNFPLPREKLVTIPNGVEVEELRRGRGPRDESLILFVGRLERYKGVQYLLEALTLLPERRLRIIGKGPYEEHLHRISKDLGVDERVEWAGSVSRKELVSNYQRAGVFALLSDLEAYGIAAAEALAAGAPAVVSITSALREFVDNRRCFGMDLPPSVPELADLLARVSSLGPGVYRGRNLLDWDTVTDRIVEEAYGLT